MTITQSRDKYTQDTQEFNKLAADFFNRGIAQANLITKTNFYNKLSDVNRKITSNKTKHLVVENELKKLKTLHLSCFAGKNYFQEDVHKIIKYFSHYLDILK